MAVGGIVAGITNLSKGAPGSEQKGYLKDIRDMYGNIQLPEYENLIAPQIYSAGEMTPEIYDAIIRGDQPQIQEDPAIRESQLGALGGMEQVAREGLPLRDRLAAQDLQRSLAGELSRADEGVMRNMAQRGRAGGGSELAARLATQGRAAETARGMGSDLAQQAQMSRVAALQQIPGLAGQIRGQDVNTAAQNSAMQQRYNEFISTLQTQAAQNAALQRQQAQAYNLGNMQRISDTNIGAKYGAIQDRNALLDQTFDASNIKLQGQAGALSNLGQLATDRESWKAKQISAIGSGVDDTINTVAKAAL